MSYLWLFGAHHPVLFFNHRGGNAAPFKFPLIGIELSIQFIGRVKNAWCITRTMGRLKQAQRRSPTGAPLQRIANSPRKIRFAHILAPPKPQSSR